MPVHHVWQRREVATARQTSAIGCHRARATSCCAAACFSARRGGCVRSATLAVRWSSSRARSSSARSSAARACRHSSCLCARGGCTPLGCCQQVLPAPVDDGPSALQRPRAAPTRHRQPFAAAAGVLAIWMRDRVTELARFRSLLGGAVRRHPVHSSSIYLCTINSTPRLIASWRPRVAGRRLRLYCYTSHSWVSLRLHASGSVESCFSTCRTSWPSLLLPVCRRPAPLVLSA